MRLTLIALLVAIALAFAAAVSSPRGDRSTHRPGAPANVAATMEVARLRASLKQVERALRMRNVSHLSTAQQAARVAALDALREYRTRGIFPHNHDFPGRRVPYFVDRHGRLCPLAYLIVQSGRPDLVARIAATHNHANVFELADDTALSRWLERNGLTLEEAGRIQPAYNHWGRGSGGPKDPPTPSVGSSAAEDPLSSTARPGPEGSIRSTHADDSSIVSRLGATEHSRQQHPEGAVRCYFLVDPPTMVRSSDQQCVRGRSVDSTCRRISSLG